MAPMNDVGAILVSGGLAAAIALWGVTSQRAITRRRSTLELIARAEADKDIIAARTKFIELARCNGGLEKYAEEDLEKEDETQKIRLVLNEFELVSIGIQRGVVDYKLYRLWFRAGVVRYWMFAEPFVKRLRQRTSNKALYHEFEEMARWMQQEKPHTPRRWAWVGKWF